MAYRKRRQWITKLRREEIKQREDVEEKLRVNRGIVIAKGQSRGSQEMGERKRKIEDIFDERVMNR